MDAQLDRQTAQIVTLRPERSASAIPLAATIGSPLAGRFCAWRGATDRRYVASVYPVALGDADAGLPEFQEFVLIGVAQGLMGRRIVSVAAIERSSDRAAALALGLARGAVEWHVHFLAEARAARAAMVADLAARHLDDDLATRCA